MDKDTGMMDGDDVLGKLTAPLAGLEGAASIEFNEAIPEGGVLTFSVSWEEGEVVEKKKKEDKGPRADASLEGETKQQL